MTEQLPIPWPLRGTPEEDMAYFESRLTHHAELLVIGAQHDPDTEAKFKEQLNKAVNRDLSSAILLLGAGLGKSMRSSDLINEMLSQIVEVQAADDYVTKDALLEQQRKQRLVKHLGKKQARWK